MSNLRDTIKQVSTRQEMLKDTYARFNAMQKEKEEPVTPPKQETDRFEFSDKFRYRMSFVDTAKDDVVAVRYGKTDLDSVKRQILRCLRPMGYDKYDNTDAIVIYVHDQTMDTPLGQAHLRDIGKQVYIDPDVFDERGIDFDIWHDYYLSDEERKHYDKSRAH